MAAIDPGQIYNTTIADLNLQYNNEVGVIGEQEGFLKENVGNAENQITQVEPGTYTAESNRANKGGLLNSGINTQRKTTIATAFAGKRTANQAKLTQGLTTFNRERETAGLKKTQGEHSALERKAQNEEALAAANPQIPTQPAAAAAAAAAPGSPGTPGYLSNGPVVRPYMERHTYGGTPNWSHNPAVRAKQEAEYRKARGG